jgi:hypothetical protein
MAKPTNIQHRMNFSAAQDAKKALAAYTAATRDGAHPDTMNGDDLDDAISYLMTDLLHYARYHPRMNPEEIHAYALDMFRILVNEELIGEAEAEAHKQEITDPFR